MGSDGEEALRQQSAPQPMRKMGPKLEKREFAHDRRRATIPGESTFVRRQMTFGVTNDGRTAKGDGG